MQSLRALLIKLGVRDAYARKREGKLTKTEEIQFIDIGEAAAQAARKNNEKEVFKHWQTERGWSASSSSINLNNH